MLKNLNKTIKKSIFYIYILYGLILSISSFIFNEMNDRLDTAVIILLLSLIYNQLIKNE